jgi:hypothetical protein
MYNASTTAPSVGATSWFRRAESWLDARGRGAWIAAMVLGFIFVWPVGLAFLAYMIWSKRMFSRHSCAHRRDHLEHRMGRHWGQTMRPSGNAAFDAYKADMLRRLEEEQSAFEAFMQRLREAKDKSEFDAFMQDRARAASEMPVDPDQEGRNGAY